MKVGIVERCIKCNQYIGQERLCVFHYSRPHIHIVSQVYCILVVLYTSCFVY